MLPRDPPDPLLLTPGQVSTSASTGQTTLRDRASGGVEFQANIAYANWHRPQHVMTGPDPAIRFVTAAARRDTKNSNQPTNGAARGQTDNGASLGLLIDRVAERLTHRRHTRIRDVLLTARSQVVDPGMRGCNPIRPSEAGDRKMAMLGASAHSWIANSATGVEKRPSSPPILG